MSRRSPPLFPLDLPIKPLSLHCSPPCNQSTTRSCWSLSRSKSSTTAQGMATNQLGDFKELTFRQELANSLYREDAATRVIARLLKERDEAREALTSLQKTMGFAAPAAAAEQGQSEDVEMPTAGTLPAQVEAKIMETNQASVPSSRCHILLTL